MRLTARTVADALTTIHERRDDVMRSSQLSVRTHADGRVRAKVIVISRYHVRPRLKGRLMAGEQGATLRGVIRESYVELFVPRMYAGLAVFLAAVGGLVVRSGNLRGPGLFVCFGGAVVLGALGYGLGRLRVSSFARDVTELEQAVEYLARPTD